MRNLPKGTLWISGLSAAGKTTLSENIFNYLSDKLNFKNVVLLDGEALRSKLERKYGFDIQERFEVVKNIVRVVNEEQKDDRFVIVATISPTLEMRNYARENLAGKFIEVYLNCPTNVCAERDYKGNYEKALTGKMKNMVGVDIPYEQSESPEVVIDSYTNGKEETLRILIESLKNHLPITTSDGADKTQSI